MIGAAALFMVMVVFAVVVSTIRESARHSRQQSLLQPQQQTGGGGVMAVPLPRPPQPVNATPAHPQASSGHKSPFDLSGISAVPTNRPATLPTSRQQYADQQRLRQREQNETDRIRREPTPPPRCSTLPNGLLPTISSSVATRGETSPTLNHRGAGRRKHARGGSRQHP